MSLILCWVYLVVRGDGSLILCWVCLVVKVDVSLIIMLGIPRCQG